METTFIGSVNCHVAAIKIHPTHSIIVQLYFFSGSMETFDMIWSGISLK